MQWVKASELTIKFNKRYYAKWLGETEIKSTGWFQKSDGTFFWYENGYVPIYKKEYPDLLILDETKADSKEAIEFADWIKDNGIEKSIGGDLWYGAIGTPLKSSRCTKAQLYKLFSLNKELKADSKVDEMKTVLIDSLKVLRTMLDKAGLVAGVETTDYLLNKYDTK